jgi:hypothetical protein
MPAKNKHAAIPNPCNSKLERSSNYRSKCSNPCAMPNGSTPWSNQIHHILCEHAILDIQPADKSQLQFIKDCLCMISWDINNSGNLIGLPLKSAYRKSNGETPVNLPCHNVDHNTADGYTQECKDWLHDNVWDTLVDQKKSHQVNAKAIQDALETCTKTFKGRLASRGSRAPGTQVGWQQRFSIPKWYSPFSMASTPTERSPGGRWLPAVFSIIR